MGLTSRLIGAVCTPAIRQPRVRIPTPSGHTLPKLHRGGKRGRHRKHKMNEKMRHRERTADDFKSTVT